MYQQIYAGQVSTIAGGTSGRVECRQDKTDYREKQILKLAFGDDHAPERGRRIARPEELHVRGHIIKPEVRGIGAENIHPAVLKVVNPSITSPADNLLQFNIITD